MTLDTELKEVFRDVAERVDPPISFPPTLKRRIRMRRMGFVLTIAMTVTAVLGGGASVVGALRPEQSTTMPDDPIAPPDETLPATSEATVTYDGKRIRSRFPTRTEPGELAVLVDNRTDELFWVALGRYVPGFDRVDLLRAARRTPRKVWTGSARAQDYASSQPASVWRGTSVVTFPLEPGRYWVIAWDASEVRTATDPGDPTFVLEVLPDIVVTKG